MTPVWFANLDPLTTAALLVVVIAVGLGAGVLLSKLTNGRG